MATAKPVPILNPGTVADLAIAVGVGVVGILMAHYPMIVSGFRRIQSDLGDTRLIHYLLEHGYRWMRGDAPHREFWSPPFFYPVTNVSAYSDTLMSVGPLYWLWRALGASPDLSFGLWMVTTSALNYAAGLLLFRRGLGFRTVAAVSAAFLVAFGSPRINQLNHQQLLSCFYIILTVFSLSRLIIDQSMGRPARMGYWLLAMLGSVSQFHGAVYPGVFLVFGLALATLTAFAMPSCRGRLFRILRQDWWAISMAGIVGLLLLQPLLSHYLRVTPEVQIHRYEPLLRALHPGISSWLSVGPSNWIWGWVERRGLLGREALNPEQHLGIGFVTTLACLLGLYVGRDRPIYRLAVLVGLMTWLITTFLPGDTITILAAAVAGYCVAALFQQTEHPPSRAIGLGIVVTVVLLTRFPNPFLQALGLIAIILCLLEIGRMRECPRYQILPAIALASLSLKLVDPYVILIGVALVIAIFGLLAYFNRGRRYVIGLAPVVSLMLFLILITFPDRLGVLLGGLVGGPAALALTARRRFRPPAWLLRNALLIAITLVALFYNTDSVWLDYSRLTPSASAIRAIGRVALTLLIPAALGLASFLEFLDRRGWVVASWIVAIFCMAEQGMTTDTFDAVANRARIDEIARQVDPDRLCFYYHPCKGQSLDHYQLDAMWASLTSGVPTINGYSGYAPRVWEEFLAADWAYGPEAADVLSEWERNQNLPPDRVQWIGADCQGKKDIPPGTPAVEFID